MLFQLFPFLKKDILHIKVLHLWNLNSVNFEKDLSFQRPVVMILHKGIPGHGVQPGTQTIQPCIGLLVASLTYYITWLRVEHQHDYLWSYKSHCLGSIWLCQQLGLALDYSLTCYRVEWIKDHWLFYICAWENQYAKRSMQCSSDIYLSVHLLDPEPGLPLYFHNLPLPGN